jgi:predicted ATPase
MLVGRRLAIGALRSAVDAAAGGAGGVVLLAGEAGMGKTALASEAAAYARARGAEAVIDDLHWADVSSLGCSCSSPASCMTPPRWLSARIATWR